MAEPKPQAAAGEQDPSMEEILQSIRRIIAEEEQTPAGQEKNGMPISSDVLELTQIVEPPRAAAEPGVAAEAVPRDVRATIESALSEDILNQEVPAFASPPAVAPMEAPVVRSP